MISLRLVASALAAAALFFPGLTHAQSVKTASNSAIFVASDKAVSFALNVPTDSNDLYFSLSGPETSWIAVGLGSNQMKNALVIMAYSADTGNITISPRLGTGHSEPTWYKNATIEWLPGSGYSNGSMTANGKCINCRSWPGGSLQVNSTSQNMIFAAGPAGDINSNSLSASVKAHSTYGVFSMNLQKASGPGGLPALSNFTSGASQYSEKSYYSPAGPAHACIMVFVFFGFMPLNLLILRILNSVKYHAMGQTIATVMALIGAGVGIYIATFFNRSKHYLSAHQILGVLIVLAVIVQFCLGYLHHRQFKKTQSTTKMAPIHIWLGRAVIPFGAINAFIGFPFALSPNYDFILGGLVVVIGIPTALILWWKSCWTKRKAKKANAPSATTSQWPSRPQEPQYQGYNESGINLTQFNPYQQQSHNYYKGPMYGEQPVEPYSRV